jgi:transposase
MEAFREKEVWDESHLYLCRYRRVQTRLDMALRPSGTTESFPNEESGVKVLVERLCEIQAVLIVLEATGGVERALVRALVAAELPVTVANPRQVRDFAKATGQLAKTDVLDAHVVARFAEAVRPGPASFAR